MRKYLAGWVIFCLPLLFLSCVTSDKEFDRQEVADTKEFEQVVKIETVKELPPEVAAQPKALDKKSKSETSKSKKKSEEKTKAVKSSQEEKVPKKRAKKKTTKKVEGKKQVKKSTKKRQPPLEDGEGFDGQRRPVVQPFRVGEELVMGISYFAVEAGKFTMKVMPMVQVNGKISYHFKYIIKSSPLFSMFYSVDDVAETFVDYETLLPYSYEIHVNESKQVRETRTYFDHKTQKATMWDRKQKKNSEVEKRKVEWDLKPFSQNVFSVAYYLRNFTLKVGKKLKVRVGHEGKNIEMTAEVLRRETLYTDAGKFDTFVVKPKFDVDGKFKPIGENYLWLTADDRKFIVRLESKIKIGSIVGEVQKIKK